jgi:hypothetical protein
MRNLRSLVVAVLFVSAPAVSFAADNWSSNLGKGVYHVAGSASYNDESWTNGDFYRSLTLSPALEYFVSNRIAIGGIVGISSIREKEGGVYANTVSS